MSDSGHFTQAILRTPAENFADGLTTSGLGAPDYALTLQQHQAYQEALTKCGLKLTVLDPDPAHPDSTFVEDTAVLTPSTAILSRPGAESRVGEVKAIQPVISKFFSNLKTIEPPGTMDGGDICEAGSHFFIGISHRTNLQGGQQLANHLSALGFTTSLVDICDIAGILHLKSGIAYLGDNNLVLIRSLQNRPEFKGFKIIDVPPGEEYAANCIRINDDVIMPSGYPGLQKNIASAGYRPLLLDMSEYQKMDGGLSCLSLRF